MDITIKDLTEEQGKTIEAFAHAVKTQQVKDIELFDAKGWSSKLNLNFFSTLNYRIKPQPSYLDLHKASGLKVGDKVKVTRKAEDYENGWGDIWDDESMDDSVGKVFEITSDAQYGGGFLLNSNWYPYFVLEKVEEEWIIKHKAKTNKDYWVLFEDIFKSKEDAEKEALENDKRNGPHFDYEFIQIK